MEWLTKELTAIEKVRRNVMLLSALALLVAFFPVRNSEISLLGAQFSSDVVAFALFHALLFYTATICVRTLIFRQLTNQHIEDFSEEIDERIEASARTEKAYWTEQIEDAAHSVRKQEALIVDLETQLLAAQAELAKAEEVARKPKRLGTAETARQAAEVVERTNIVETLKFERTTAEAGLQSVRVHALRVEDSVKAAAQQRASHLSARGPTARMLAVYVMVGEYLFPIAVGVAATALLLRSQSFPMFWEIPLLANFFHVPVTAS